MNYASIVLSDRLISILDIYDFSESECFHQGILLSSLDLILSNDGYLFIYYLNEIQIKFD